MANSYKHHVQFPHPTSHRKDRQFHSRHTRPITIKVSNAMMEACFALLTATKEWPEIKTDDLAVARQKAIDAFTFWRKTHGGPGSSVNENRKRYERKKKRKEMKDARRSLESAPVDDPNPGSLPGDFAGKGRE